MSTIGGKIDQLFQLRENKRQLEEQVKVIKDQIDAIELDTIAQMNTEGVSKATGKQATVSISQSVKPSVEDWDLFYGFIKKNNYFHLLERRPSVTGCRELFETKGKIPGVVPFTQVTLNMRTTS